MQAMRIMSKPANAQARRARKEMCLDLLNDKNSPIVEIELENKNDYSRVDKIIESLNLNETQALALECRMNGMSYPEIARTIGRAISSSYETLKLVQKRYMSIYG